jgi:hypothetical protein
MRNDEQTAEARRRRKAWLLGLVLILLIALATDAAFLFDTTRGADAPGGTGTGSPGTGAAAGKPYTIGGTAQASLHPGREPVPIDLTFSNPNAGNGGSGADGVRVAHLRVTISSVTGPNVSAESPCTAVDFAVTQFGGDTPVFLPEGSSSLSSLGFPQSTWPKLTLVDRPVDQDGCKGATVHLSYEGTP